MRLCRSSGATGTPARYRYCLHRVRDLPVQRRSRTHLPRPSRLKAGASRDQATSDIRLHAWRRVRIAVARHSDNWPRRRRSSASRAGAAAQAPGLCVGSGQKARPRQTLSCPTARWTRNDAPVVGSTSLWTGGIRAMRGTYVRLGGMAGEQAGAGHSAATFPNGRSDDPARPCRTPWLPLRTPGLQRTASLRMASPVQNKFL